MVCASMGPSRASAHRSRAYQFCYRQENGLEGFLVLNTRLAVGPVHLVDWAASTPEVLIDLLQANAAYSFMLELGAVECAVRAA